MQMNPTSHESETFSSLETGQSFSGLISNISIVEKDSLSKNNPDFIKALKDGDSQAWKLLLQSYHHKLCKFAYRLVHRTALAEEIVQEAWLKAARDIPRFEGKSSISIWLYTIVNHCAGMYRRVKKNDYGFLEDLSPQNHALVLQDSNDPPDVNVICKDTYAKALGILTDKKRETLQLLLEGHTYEEIATALKIPKNTAITRAYYALKDIEAAHKTDSFSL